MVVYCKSRNAELEKSNVMKVLMYYCCLSVKIFESLMSVVLKRTQILHWKLIVTRHDTQIVYSTKSKKCP